MKRLNSGLSFTSLFISGLSLLAISSQAAIADEPKKQEQPNTELKAVYNHIDKEKFTKTRSQKGHHLSFSEGYVLGTYEHPLREDTDVNFGVGYMNTKFSFTHHPKDTSFRQQNFNNLLVQFGGTTRAVDQWKWDGGIVLQMNTDHLSFSRYTFFTGMLHGCNKYKKNTNLHAGIVAYTGMRYTRVIPIIGFDHRFSKKLKLNVVYPLNISLVYSIDNHWALDATMRYVLTRQRLKDQGQLPRGLVAYRNWGTEAGITYALNPACKLNLHVGETFGSRMRISDKHDSNRKHLKLDSGLYYGFEASFAF